jgi:hypothetical protein
MKGRSIGMLLLAIYLILEGLVQLASLHFQYQGVLMGILALAAGVLILIGK